MKLRPNWRLIFEWIILPVAFWCVIIYALTRWPVLP